MDSNSKLFAQFIGCDLSSYWGLNHTIFWPFLNDSPKNSSSWKEWQRDFIKIGLLSDDKFTCNIGNWMIALSNIKWWTINLKWLYKYVPAFYLYKSLIDSFTLLCILVMKTCSFVVLDSWDDAIEILCFEHCHWLFLGLI